MYTVYKITNQINGKYYIGVHKTKNPNDYYMGSGRAIKSAIQKYGKDSFKKEILFITECKLEAFEKEKSLTENFSLSDNYNLRLGGVGGFTKEIAKKGYKASLGKLTSEQHSANGKKGYLKANINHSECGRKGGLANKGKPKSEAHKESLRETWKRKKLERTDSSMVRADPS